MPTVDALPALAWQTVSITLYDIGPTTTEEAKVQAQAMIDKYQRSRIPANPFIPTGPKVNVATDKIEIHQGRPGTNGLQISARLTLPSSTPITRTR